nr:MAG TPA: hypothetical protein [Caudoviricetes sp.]
MIKGGKIADNRLYVDCLPGMRKPAHDKSEG